MNIHLSLLASLTVFCPMAQGQGTFRISWSSLTGGGAQGTGGVGYSLAASIGQFAAGEPDGAPSGPFSLTGGYWTFTLEQPFDLNFTIEPSGGFVILSWDDEFPVIVERSADLRLWTPVSSQPASPPYQDRIEFKRFYRLRRAP